MGEVEFVPFSYVNSEEFLELVNDDSLRTHLVEHPYFDMGSLREWIQDKVNIDAMNGCRIRAVYIDGILAGWCGIQPDKNGFELAVVISQQFWGYGIAIFKTIMCWANELGHKKVIFHLLETRPEYRALKKVATKVDKTELAGRHFTTYHLAVDLFPQ